MNLKYKPALFSFLITILYFEYNIALLYIIIINNISWMKTLWFDNTNYKNNNYADNNSKSENIRKMKMKQPRMRQILCTEIVWVFAIF